jgi:hypothetical protein
MLASKDTKLHKKSGMTVFRNLASSVIAQMLALRVLRRCTVRAKYRYRCPRIWAATLCRYRLCHNMLCGLQHRQRPSSVVSVLALAVRSEEALVPVPTRHLITTCADPCWQIDPFVFLRMRQDRQHLLCRHRRLRLGLMALQRRDHRLERASWLDLRLPRIH